MKIDAIFSNFVGGNVLKTINNDALETFILDLEKKDKGRIISNYGGWQSNDLSLQENSLKDLIVEIEKNLVPFDEVLCVRKEFKLAIGNLWANVNGLGAMNLPHIHYGSVLSGVYYVTLPDKSGRLKLMNPNPFNFAALQSLGGIGMFTEKPTSFTTEHLELLAAPGALLIFPSHLCHYVLPNLSKEKRIAFSFNTKIEKRYPHN